MRSIRDEYDEGEWVDASTVGTPFEVQLNQRTGQWRHRALNPLTRAPTEDWHNGPVKRNG